MSDPPLIPQARVADLAGVLAPSRIAPRMPIRDYVANVLRVAILEGAIPPGQRLREEELARHLSVSRMPLREAFSVLEAEGLLVRMPNRGAVVAEFTLEEIEEVFRIRSVVEGLAAEQAATRLDEIQLARLREITDEMDRWAKDGGVDDITPIHVEFHSLIWGANGRTLANLCQSLYHRFPNVGRVLPDNQWDSVRDYRAMVDALSSRNGKVAGELMRKHIEEGGRVVDHLRRARSSERQPRME